VDVLAPGEWAFLLLFVVFGWTFSVAVIKTVAAKAAPTTFFLSAAAPPTTFFLSAAAAVPVPRTVEAVASASVIASCTSVGLTRHVSASAVVVLAATLLPVIAAAALCCASLARAFRGLVMSSSDAGECRASVSGCDGPEPAPVVNSQVNTSATSPSPFQLDEEEPEELSTPRKKRRTWPGPDADLLCATAVTTVGAHLAEWVRGEQMYKRAAQLFNEQPRRPFETDGRTMKDHFCHMLRKFNKRDDVAASRSGVSETQTRFNSLLDEANSANRDSRLLAAAAKGTQSKKDEALLRAGETVRRSATNRRLARRAASGEAVAMTKGAPARGVAPAAANCEGDGVGGGQRRVATEDEGDSAADGGTEVPDEASSPPEPSPRPAAARRRRMEDAEDEKDEAVFELLERSVRERHAARERHYAAEEKRLELNEWRLQHEQRVQEQLSRQRATEEAARVQAAASAAANAAADRAERARLLELMSALARPLG